MVSISSAFRGVKWGSFVARETEANPWRLGWEEVQPSCAVGILQLEHHAMQKNIRVTRYRVPRRTPGFGMYTIQKGKAENVTEGSGEVKESSLSTSSFRFTE